MPIIDTTLIDSTTLTALERFPAQLEAYYAAIPRGVENWRPDSWTGVPSEPFTPIEQICHVRDIEVDGYHARFARVLQESDPVLANIDGETIARERCYEKADAAEVFAVFRAARAKSLSMISAFTSAQLSRTAQFDGHPATLRSLVHFLCSHDQQHLSGLQWLLARIEGAR